MPRAMRLARLAAVLVLAVFPARVVAQPPLRGPVAAAVETTLATRGDHIRQLAFDGDWASSFASVNAPGSRDHVTLVLDQPVTLHWAAATTGRPDGGEAVECGTLEVSAGGTTFRALARFAGGTARGGPADGPVRAIRIRPGPSDRPIAIRQPVIDVDPPVAPFLSGDRAVKGRRRTGSPRLAARGSRLAWRLALPGSCQGI